MIQHKIISAKNYAYIEISRSPTLKEGLMAAERFAADAECRRGLNLVLDFSLADLSNFEEADVARFLAYIRHRMPLVDGARCAVLQPEVDETGIYAVIAQHVDRDRVEFFTDPVAAMDWTQHELDEDAMQFRRAQPKRADETPLRVTAPVVYDKILMGVA